MIVVEVRLHSAVTGKRTILNTVVIDLIGVTHEGRRGSYRVRALAKSKEWLDLMFGKKPIREAQVLDHPRLSKPVLNLVYKALVELGYGK